MALWRLLSLTCCATPQHWNYVPEISVFDVAPLQNYTTRLSSFGLLKRDWFCRFVSGTFFCQMIRWFIQLSALIASPIDVLNAERPRVHLTDDKTNTLFTHSERHTVQSSLNHLLSCTTRAFQSQCRTSIGIKNALAWWWIYLKSLYNLVRIQYSSTLEHLQSL